LGKSYALAYISVDAFTKEGKLSQKSKTAVKVALTHPGIHHQVLPENMG